MLCYASPSPSGSRWEQNVRPRTPALPRQCWTRAYLQLRPAAAALMRRPRAPELVRREKQQRCQRVATPPAPGSPQELPAWHGQVPGLVARMQLAQTQMVAMLLEAAPGQRWPELPMR